VEEAAKGQAFIIAKAGRLMVKVVPLGDEEKGDKGKLGFMAGEISVPDDFDAMAASDWAPFFNVWIL